MVNRLLLGLEELPLLRLLAFIILLVLQKVLFNHILSPNHPEVKHDALVSSVGPFKHN